MTEPASLPVVETEWFDQELDAEAGLESVARGGQLSDVGRREAIAAALPLVGRYFASGNQPLYSQPALALGARSGHDETADLLAAIRLRVALAAAKRLQNILTRISERPTFRYQLNAIDSTGAVTGQLDINRYVTQRGIVGETPVYPILEVRRVEETPENVLAVYATRWVLRELDLTLSVSGAAADGPERTEHRRQTRALQAVLELPGFSACSRRASEINRRQSERGLVADVKRRLRRREISNASPYAELVDWVDQTLAGAPAAEPGDIDWSFYGERFDTKLFELWCLNLLAQEVSRQLVLEEPKVNTSWRRGAPTYSWDRPSGTLELYFQRSIGNVSPSHTARWQLEETPERVLRGVPDIVCHATPRGDQRDTRFAVIDPKLRQRDGAPVEELYKILGYFDNFGLANDAFGAVLYHTTASGTLPCANYVPSGGVGRLLAIALNPAYPSRSQAALAPAAKMLLELLGIPPLADEIRAGDASNAVLSGEEMQEIQVKARLKELEAAAAVLPPHALDASRRRVRTLVGDDRWILLPEPVQTMLATAEYVGFSIDSTADFSGPVIGICVSIETVLHDQVISPVVALDSSLSAAERLTLGQVIYQIRDAVNGGTSNLQAGIREHLQGKNVDLTQVASLALAMGSMNAQYRIPAAHRHLVHEATWQNAWNSIIGPSSLLAQVIDVFTPRPSV